MELVIWILFVLISLIFQALKKKNTPPNNPDFEVEGEHPPTLQDALREIQEALQQGRQPGEARQQTPVPTAEPVSKTDHLFPTERKRDLPKRTDQEFKGLESPRRKELFAEDEFERKRRREMDLRRQELQRQRKEKQRALQQASLKKTSKEAPLKLEVIQKKPTSDIDRFKEILKDRQQLQDAFLFNEILGTPVSLRNRRR